MKFLERFRLLNNSFHGQKSDQISPVDWKGGRTAEGDKTLDTLYILKNILAVAWAMVHIAICAKHQMRTYICDVYSSSVCVSYVVQYERSKML